MWPFKKKAREMPGAGPIKVKIETDPVKRGSAGAPNVDIIAPDRPAANKCLNCLNALYFTQRQDGLYCGLCAGKIKPLPDEVQEKIAQIRHFGLFMQGDTPLNEVVR